jgi:TonB family protein
MPSPSHLAARVALALLPACMSAEDAQNAIAAVRDDAPDELPIVRNAELPFHYPPALFEKRVEGNVTLRLYIDSLGAVRPESTAVAEPSGHAALDSAAVAGARALRFAPARRAGAAVGVAVLFPVHFRHPATVAADSAGDPARDGARPEPVPDGPR